MFEMGKVVISDLLVTALKRCCNRMNVSCQSMHFV